MSELLSSKVRVWLADYAAALEHMAEATADATWRSVGESKAKEIRQWLETSPETSAVTYTMEHIGRALRRSLYAKTGNLAIESIIEDLDAALKNGGDHPMRGAWTCEYIGAGGRCGKENEPLSTTCWFCRHPKAPAPTETRAVTQEIPDGWALVPREADVAIVAYIPHANGQQARDFYRRLVAFAELSGGAILRVRHWSCNIEAGGHARCAEWCRIPDQCPGSAEVMHRPALKTPAEPT